MITKETKYNISASDLLELLDISDLNDPEIQNLFINENSEIILVVQESLD